MWLDVTRDNVVRTLKKSYVENKDYFFIDKNEEFNLSKISQKTFHVVSNNKQYIKLTVDCLKKNAMGSNSKNGRLTKQYYIEMERIVKDFSNQELQRLQNENTKLRRNLHPVKISDREGLYVWHEENILKYRIGSGEDLNRRIKQHNSSHADNIIVDFYLETNCYKDLESIVLKILDSYRYRNNKDFFDCDIKIIKQAIKKSNNLLLEFRNNCDERTIKKNNNVVKKISKKNSKKISKKTSKKPIKKTSKKINTKLPKKNVKE